MKLPRNSKAYMHGLRMFLDFAFSQENTDMEGMILCTCKIYKNGICLPREDVEVHLNCVGFIKSTGSNKMNSNQTWKSLNNQLRSKWWLLILEGQLPIKLCIVDFKIGSNHKNNSVNKLLSSKVCLHMFTLDFLNQCSLSGLEDQLQNKK